MVATDVEVIVVGAGMMGLKAALRVLELPDAPRVALIDAQTQPGGIWRSAANRSSRVQMPEPFYRLLPDVQGEDFTQQPEILAHAEEACQRLAASGRCQILLGTCVVGVRDQGPDFGVLVELTSANQSAPSTLRCKEILLCTGGLKNPRKLIFPGERAFKGDIVDGIGGHVDSLDFRGKNVVILGMGAFGVENARTALFGGATNVTIVARSMNIVLCKMTIYQVFNADKSIGRARDAPKKHDGDPRAKVPVKMLDLVSRPFLVAGQEAIRTLSDMMPQPGQGGAAAALTVRTSETLPTASDVFFIGHALGKLSCHLGEVVEMSPEGIAVTTAEGKVCAATAVPRAGGCMIPCDVIIKNFGFEQFDPHLRHAVRLEYRGGQEASEPPRMTPPLWFSPRVVYLRGERPPVRKGEMTAAAAADFPRLPASITLLTEVFLEIWLFFRDRPDLVEGFISEEEATLALPRVPMEGDNFVALSLAWWPIMDTYPELRSRLDAIRAGFNRETLARYDAVQFMRENRAWWRSCCERIAGDPVAVPWPFEAELGKAEAATATTYARL